MASLREDEMKVWFCCADKGATEEIFRGVGYEYFLRPVLWRFRSVFCKGRAEEEEKVEHVRWSLFYWVSANSAPPPSPLSTSVFTLQRASKCADSRQPKLSATSLIGMTTLSFTLLSLLGARCLNNWKLLDRNTMGYATTQDTTTNECYNEQILSIKSGCYNECGAILSADAARAWGVRLYFSLRKDCLCFLCALYCLCFLLGKVCS